MQRSWGKSKNLKSRITNPKRPNLLAPVETRNFAVDITHITNHKSRITEKIVLRGFTIRVLVVRPLHGAIAFGVKNSTSKKSKQTKWLDVYLVLLDASPSPSSTSYGLGTFFTSNSVAQRHPIRPLLMCVCHHASLSLTWTCSLALATPCSCDARRLTSARERNKPSKKLRCTHNPMMITKYIESSTVWSWSQRGSDHLAITYICFFSDPTNVDEVLLGLFRSACLRCCSGIQAN